MIILLFIVLGLYCSIVIVALFGWLRSEEQVDLTDENYTLIIPFRNEESELPRLLKEIGVLPKNVEVLLINDHSTDHSVSIIESELSKLNNVRLIHAVKEGKKNAVALGISESKNEYIAFTDADSSVNDKVFRTMVSSLVDTRAEFAYGPVINYSERNFLSRLFFLDQLAINSISLGIGKFNLHAYCSGANMAGTKTFLIGCTEALVNSNNLSGDDVTILETAVRNHAKTIVHCSSEVVVQTRGPVTPFDFLQQRLRWGQKAGKYTNPLQIGLSLVIFFGLIRYYSENLVLFGLVPLAIKLVIDLLFLFLVSIRLRTPKKMVYFLPAWIMNFIYVPLVGVVGMVYSGQWKGRNIRS
jgi:cellulose synthase/poly-beta-1,6-N-acetylglucosamine synthase-like glycosyltransferase